MNTILERLERHIIRMADGECWETDLAGDKDGYPLLRNSPAAGCDSPSVRCSRLAWEAHNAEPIPEGALILHTCDNPRCVNPEHLVLGNNSDNSVDAIDKGRRRPGYKTQQWDYDAIRQLNETMLLSQIATFLGYSQNYNVNSQHLPPNSGFLLKCNLNVNQ